MSRSDTTLVRLRGLLLFAAFPWVPCIGCDDASVPCDNAACFDACVESGRASGVCSAGLCICLGAADADADADVDADEDAEVAPVCADPPGVGPDGADCACTADCIEGAVCFTEEEWGIASGACVRACALGSDDCGEGAICQAVEGGDDMGLCWTSCALNEDCEDDQICGYEVCLSFCTDDGQCRSGPCDPYTARCLQGEPPEGAGVDGECLRDEDCRSQVCDTAEGRCVTLCSTQHGGCPEDASCVPSDWDLLGRCLSGCTTSDECAGGFDCVAIADPLDARVCLAAGTAPECFGRAAVVTEGAPCGCADDCSLGARCSPEENGLAPGGMCIRTCELDDPLLGPTGPGDECGSDYVCVYSFDVPSSEGGGACHPLCGSSDDCPPGRICSATLGCVPHCQRDDDCRLGLCDPYTGWCGVSFDPAELATGAACDRGSDCRGDCRRDAAREHGFCTSACSISAQVCPDDAVCVDDGEGDDMGYCAARCADDTDCTTPGTACAPESRPGLGRHCDLT